MPHPHWQYFIAIESDLEKTGRYVEIAQGNFLTYSIELARILLSASSEVDVISKLICQRINPKKSYKTIDDYRKCILSQYPNFPSFEITIPRYGLVRTPWKDWGSGKNPLWWKGYNNVKHERSKFFEEANLENALDSVAGLFCIVLAYNHDMLETSPWPKLLHVEEDMMVSMVF
jgi:hypothetical protein